jgi:hypothetical protein
MADESAPEVVVMQNVMLYFYTIRDIGRIQVKLPLEIYFEFW